MISKGEIQNEKIICLYGIGSSLDWQRDDIEYAIENYVNSMSPELLERISDGKKDFLKYHQRFEEDITNAVAQLESML